MGQVLGFAHCKEAPSTASSTPDSTEGGPEDPPPFPELPEEPPEEEEEEDEEDEEDEDDEDGPPRARPSPPRELTFSYIAFGGGGRGGGGAHPPRRGRAPPPRRTPPPPTPPRRAPGTPDPPKRSGGAPEPPLPHPENGGGARSGRGGGRGEEEEEERPGRKASPAPLPSPPPGGAPPEPPRASAPPPPAPDQSASAAGADGQVWELLLWRVPHRSALALLVSLVSLGALSRFSAIAVLAHGALAVLAVTVPLRLRQVALSALRPPPAEPQSRAQPWSLSQEQQQRWARGLARHSVAAARTLTRLFLVHSVPESLKFAFLFYLLTYVGAACNGVTLLAAGVISAFTFPVLYRRHQAQIDQYLSLARGHLSHLRARVLAKLPSAKVKPQ